MYSHLNNICIHNFAVFFCLKLLKKFKWNHRDRKQYRRYASILTSLTFPIPKSTRSHPEVIMKSSHTHRHTKVIPISDAGRWKNSRVTVVKGGQNLPPLGWNRVKWSAKHWELQFWTILFPYKKYVTEKRKYLNTGCKLLNLYHLMVLFSISIIKLPCENNKKVW